jgi:hypothetical protein
MNKNKKTPKLLGAAFLFVLFASFISGSLLTSATGSGSISDMLLNISNNLTTMRASILIGLITSVGIVVLAALLYVVLSRQNKTIALVALGWWLAEAITLAVSKIGLSALIPLSLEYVAAGAPSTSHFQSLGNFLYSGVYLQGDEIHMLFYCLGGVLWFYLFLVSRYIPRVLSVLGIVIESVALIGIILLLLNVNAAMVFFYPVAVLELSVGLWLVVKGIGEHKNLAQSEN